MNIGNLLSKTAKIFPDQMAIVHGDYEINYREANERVNQLANAFSALGLRKGDNLAILLHNCPEFIETLFACFKAGITTVPINFRLHPEECRFIIDNSESAAVVLGADFRDDLYILKDGMPKVKHFICVDESIPGMEDYENLVESQPVIFEAEEVENHHVAWIFYTSGTTGMPKGAMLTHHNILTMTMNFFADVCPLGPEDAVLHAAPLSHGSGLYAIPNVAKAAANVILETRSFEPEAVFKTIERRKITNMFAAPTMIKRLITHSDIKQYDLSSLKCINYGGGPIHVQDLKDMVKVMGQVFVQIFGQAESPMTISYLRKEEHLTDGNELQLKRLASAGIPRTDVEVRVVDENDIELPNGTLGEIVVRGEVVMKGYWKNAQATKDTIRKGWLRTGDLGVMDEYGYIYIMDRSKDMIISGGENVYSREIEDVIIKHPSVFEVAVIGVPDDTWGEAIKAIVALKEGQSASEEEIISFCKKYLASYKKPKSVDFVDELPKSAYGKILKREIRDKYWAQKKRKV